MHKIRLIWNVLCSMWIFFRYLDKAYHIEETKKAKKKMLHSMLIYAPGTFCDSLLPHERTKLEKLGWVFSKEQAFRHYQNKP